jgi:hypothetical protein
MMRERERERDDDDERRQRLKGDAPGETWGRIAKAARVWVTLAAVREVLASLK